ncbi:hypothetical protein POM88_002172 [Heracleum sosnowskyi]|uniref:Uncharacterized protein n=1 Tax=Heracleum sosnowskyi TaxID=360622 RepID=A0AAD8JHH8_9APIA|nr:hypothetical protein POM88_002172 [Heracleum sosnowskyi]
MEAKMYLGNEKLPNRMLSLQCSNTSNLESASGEEDATRDEEIPKNLNLRSYPFEVGGLQIRSLGKILKDSELLYDCNYICREGYTSVRKFPLISDPKNCSSHKMEVLRNGDMLNKPMFRVTSEKGYQVHTRCYGSWNLLMGHFVTGGAMKPTTDWCWAHLAFAICIPETFLLDVRKMEAIDALNVITKCSNITCHVAYHPLCARAARFYFEFEDGDRLRLNSEEGEDNLGIRLISYCKSRRRPSDRRIVVQDKIGQSAHQQSNYIPSLNPPGCARNGLS